MEYEPGTVIVGGGIAGLYSAYLLANKNKTGTIIESQRHIGGRISTWKQEHPTTKTPFQIEAGAGRLANTHKHLLGLIREFNLTLTPLSSCWNTLQVNQSRAHTRTHQPSPISILPKGLRETTVELVEHYAKNPRNVDPTKSLFQNLKSEFGKSFADAYRQILGYDAELDIMAPKAALKTLADDFTATEQYSVKEGYSELARRMEAFIKRRGWRILTSEAVEEIGGVDGEWLIETPKRVILTGSVIVAVPPNVASKFSVSSPISRYWRSFVSTPLLRVYAIYPRNEDTGGVWWEGSTKLTTNSPLGMIIPINPAQGLIMISYTDSRRADALKKEIGDLGVEHAISRHLGEVFPGVEIPAPLWIRDQYWKEGVWYWGIGGGGRDDVEKIQGSYRTLKYVGEPLSEHQAWVEGALESVRAVIH